MAWSKNDSQIISGGGEDGVLVWDLRGMPSKPDAHDSSIAEFLPTVEQVQYTNAKVLLVGESGTGKTGLSQVLAGQGWKPTDSTVGAWATQWKIPVSSDNSIEREIWLWDFGGQADQRLIHQLYMDDTSLAVLVFDGQKENVLETLGQWTRDMARSARKPFTKLLAAGRVDTGGLRLSVNQIRAFVREHDFAGFVETSSKTGAGCLELQNAILGGIRWSDIPWRSSPRLFKRLREEIIHLKEEGRVLMRFKELRDALRLRMPEGDLRFRDDELEAVIGLLSVPGVVWELGFGSWILLQPEQINAYAQVVIQTVRADEHERGMLAEERVLRGALSYQTSLQRLRADEERFVLLAMHQILIERGLCLRQHTDEGPVLIFPSFYRRERPELCGHPAVLVSYQFGGFLDDIYATLVVRLHHTRAFQRDELWRYAADFRTVTGKQLGIKMNRTSEGMGDLIVYFDPTISANEKIIFSRYVHEHLLQNARDVIRLRHYVCSNCGTPVGNRDVAMRRLNEWQALVGKDRPPTIVCAECEERVLLWDELEQCFADPELQRLVRGVREQVDVTLDNESKERLLVGDVISTVALAGQLSREFSVSDHGVDMEIEFKDDDGEASGRKVYLQLKSGDSHLRRRASDNAEVFSIKNLRHARYWVAQPVPVFLVIRSSRGEIRWMEIRTPLTRAMGKGKSVKDLVFEGERFDVMSLRRYRDSALVSSQFRFL